MEQDDAKKKEHASGKEKDYLEASRRFLHLIAITLHNVEDYLGNRDFVPLLFEQLDRKVENARNNLDRLGLSEQAFLDLQKMLEALYVNYESLEWTFLSLPKPDS